MNPESLISKLPLIKDWIDNKLIEHAKMARPVSTYGFKRLPLFYSANFLANAKVVEVDRVPVPRLSELGLTEFADFERGDYTGITFKDTYFVKVDQIGRESLHFHELVHVIQWAHLGIERFLMAYAGGLAANGYRNSPLEVMAYELQAHFDQNGQPGDVEAVVRNKLNGLYG